MLVIAACSGARDGLSIDAPANQFSQKAGSLLRILGALSGNRSEETRFQMERKFRFFNSQVYKCSTPDAYLVQGNLVAGWMDSES
jgi:hypothetical protein